jgi:alkylation response protein AidB-like acyl-CoA dehydrogenase
MAFQPPIAEIAFTLDKIAGLDGALASGLFGDLQSETVTAILNEAGRFASDELAPINRTGDRVGARRQNGGVATPPGWAEAYGRFRAAGWNGITAPVAWGGQGLPIMLGMAVQELWNAGAAAFAVGPMLTAGAIDALAAHASPPIKELYLPRLASGEWMATMNLTEPQAGSDLGAVQTRAERAADGTYRLFGQKNFITFGEHDFTDNIVHLVLARLRDAPEGTRGISLFLAPKRIPNADGSLGARNDLACAGIETKLGLHGSPTCTMVYGGNGDGAVAWLVGEENRGLACMFTMMNIARLSVGIQGVGVADRAFADALTYARERRQGRAPGATGAGMSPIVAHPDVQGMLLRMKAMTAASRAICYLTAQAIDMSRCGKDPERSRYADRAGLLTPIAKAFATDVGIEVASLGIQIHGGMGFIEEAGAAQHLRDVRVFSIYEGTNGIQAIDLVTRKLKLAGGDAVASLLGELDAIAEAAEASNRSGLGETGLRLARALGHLREATGFVMAALDRGEPSEVLAGATPYLRLFALTLGGALLAKGSLAAGDTDKWIALARFFAETIVDETAALAKTVTGGAAALRQAASAVLSDGE